METEDGWVGLGVVGQRLANIASDFDPRTYGFRKLSDLVRQTGAFDMDQPEGRAVRIRAKPTPPTQTRRARRQQGPPPHGGHNRPKRTLFLRAWATSLVAFVPPPA